MKLRTKALVVLIAFAAIVGGACGARAYADAEAATRAEEEEAAAAAVELADSEFTVTALGEGAQAALGGEEAADELARKVGAWCEENVEGATTAEWDGKMTCDFNAGSVDVSYRLDDGKATKVNVRAYPATGQLIVSKAVV